MIKFDIKNGKVTQRSKELFKELLKNQQKIKKTIDKEIFKYHKKFFELILSHSGVFDIKKDLINYNRNYEPYKYSFQKVIKM